MSGWEPVESWETEQPQRCTVCNEVLCGRELGYIPNICERAGCPGPTTRITRTIVRVDDSKAAL